MKSRGGTGASSPVWLHASFGSSSSHALGRRSLLREQLSRGAWDWASGCRNGSTRCRLGPWLSSHRAVGDQLYGRVVHGTDDVVVHDVEVHLVGRHAAVHRQVAAAGEGDAELERHVVANDSLRWAFAHILSGKEATLCANGSPGVVLVRSNSVCAVHLPVLLPPGCLNYECINSRLK